MTVLQCLSQRQPMHAFQQPTPRAARAAREGFVDSGAGRDGGDGVDARLAPLTASLVARLGPVCRHWDAAAFDALVARVARTQLRWADRDGLA